jgi:hypothetical protein
MNWFLPSLDRDRWMTHMNLVINLRVPQNIGKFLSSWATGGFSRTTQFYGVSYEGVRILSDIHFGPRQQDTGLQYIPDADPMFINVSIETQHPAALVPSCTTLQSNSLTFHLYSSTSVREGLHWGFIPYTRQRTLTKAIADRPLR